MVANSAAISSIPLVRRARISRTIAVLVVWLAVLGVGGSLSPVLAAPAAQGQERQVRRSFAAHEGMEVRLENLAGAVTIEGEAGGEIEVVGTIHADAGSVDEAQALLELLEVSFESRGERVIVRAEYPVDRYKVYRYPQPGGGRSRTTTRYQGERVKVVSRDEGDAVTLYADFHVRLPHGVGADINNQVGDISATGVQGPLSADTGSGDVTASDGIGSLSADTGSGDVTVRNYEGDISADTGSGDVEVTSIRGDLSADTGSGDITVTDVEAGRVSADTGSGDVNLERVTGSLLADTGSGDVEAHDLRAGARLNADTGSGDVILAGDLSRVEEIVVETGSGDIEINMSAVPGMRLRIESGNGDIDVDLPEMRVISKQRYFFEGEVKDATARVSLSTGSGSIRVSGR